MNILIVEDEDTKLDEIKQVIYGCYASGDALIDEARSINSAMVALGAAQFDLVIADLVLPQINGSLEPCDATPQWCEYIENHAGSKVASWVIMTSFSDIAEEARRSFAMHGVAVIQYDETNAWRTVLSNRVRDRFVNPPLDFAIICALEKERDGLLHCPNVELGDTFSAAGLDCRNVDLNGLRGVAVTLPRAGLITAAIGTVKIAELFSPKAIAMSGICGGVDGESELGDLIVPDVSWNYQAGKITQGKLRPELVQIPLPPLSRTTLQLMATDEVSKKMREGLFHSELSSRKILMPPMVSGSQVVADSNVVSEIASQSRKIGALDMEVAAVFTAAHDYFNGGGIYFAAKTVVDLADKGKDDRYHEYGSVLSARFTCEALKRLL